MSGNHLAISYPVCHPPIVISCLPFILPAQLLGPTCSLLLWLRTLCSDNMRLYRTSNHTLRQCCLASEWPGVACCSGHGPQAANCRGYIPWGLHKCPAMGSPLITGATWSLLVLLLCKQSKPPAAATIWAKPPTPPHCMSSVSTHTS